MERLSAIPQDDAIVQKANTLPACQRHRSSRMTHTFPLHFQAGHLFAEIAGERWLFDTGAPLSFGKARELSLAGERFSLGQRYVGLDAAALSRLMGVNCTGLLGADIIGRFDHLLDVAGGLLTVSTATLAHGGQLLELDDFMGIPIITVHIERRDYRMFLDTGAQISYFQHAALAGFPPAGSLTDFYPGFGEFQTETHRVPASIGDGRFTLRCGSLPRLLGMTLGVANVDGIVGNEIFLDRSVGYFPRRQAMSL